MTRGAYEKIRPELISIGDTIEVIHREDKGVVTRKRGTVARRDYVGTIRILYTAEGAELYQWVPSQKNASVFLLARGGEYTPEPLFDMERMLDNA